MKQSLAAILGVTITLQTAPALASGTAAARTAIVDFKPAMMTKSAKISGYCWSDSIASQRADAFRCMAGNAIYDPCFEIDAKTVACPSANVSSGTRMTLTKPLPGRAGKSASTAWMMQLAGGAACSMGTGTVVEGHPFECTKNLVCSAPSGNAAAIYVTCGVAESSVKVTKNGHYLVTKIYR